MPRRTIAAGSRAVMSSPSKVSLPRVGSSTPEIVFRIVLLPAPLLPSTVAISPRRTSRLTPRIALIGPYALSTLASARTASPVSHRGAQRQREVVQRHRRAQVQPRELRRRHREPGVAVGHALPAREPLLDDDAERERRDREVDALDPQRRQADDGAHRGRHTKSGRTLMICVWRRRLLVPMLAPFGRSLNFTWFRDN